MFSIFVFLGSSLEAKDDNGNNVLENIFLKKGAHHNVEDFLAYFKYLSYKDVFENEDVEVSKVIDNIWQVHFFNNFQ